MKPLTKFKALLAGSLLSVSSLAAQDVDIPDIQVPQFRVSEQRVMRQLESEVQKLQSILPSEQFLTSKAADYLSELGNLEYGIVFDKYKNLPLNQDSLVSVLKAEQSKYFTLTDNSFVLNSKKFDFDGSAEADFDSLKYFQEGDFHLSEGNNNLYGSLKLNGNDIERASLEGNFKGFDFNAALTGFASSKNTQFNSAEFNFNGKSRFTATIDNLVAGKVTSINNAAFTLDGKHLGSLSNLVVDSSKQFRMSIGEVNIGQRSVKNFYFNSGNSIVRFGGYFQDKQGIIRSAQLDGIAGYDGKGIIGQLLISDPLNPQNIALLNYRVNTLYDALALLEQAKHMSFNDFSLFSGNIHAQLISNGKTINSFVKGDTKSTSFVLNIMDHWNDGKRVYAISDGQASALNAAIKENKFTEAVSLMEGITPGTKFEFNRAVEDFGSPFPMLAYSPIYSHPAFGMDVELYASKNDVIIDARKGIFFGGIVLSNDQEFFGVTRNRDCSAIFGIKYLPEFYQAMGDFTLNEGGGFVLAVNNGVTLGFDSQKSTKAFFSEAGMTDFPKILNNRFVANANIHLALNRKINKGWFSLYLDSVFAFREDTSNRFPLHFNGADVPITMIPTASAGFIYLTEDLSLGGKIVSYDAYNNNKPYFVATLNSRF